MAERDQRRTGGLDSEWVEYDSPKPPPVDDRYAYWSSGPPTLSERCAWWVAQISRGWRPNKSVRSEGADSAAGWYGVYIWEFVHVIYPTLRDAIAEDQR